jgi:hypothetical protein
MMTSQSIKWLAAVTALLLLAACSSDSSDSSDAEVSLDETGIYSGTLETPSGDVALVRAVIARTGEAVLTIENNDSEIAGLILSGNVDSSLQLNGELSDSVSNESVALSLEITDAVLTSSLESAAISGAINLVQMDTSQGADLSRLAGEYVKVSGTTIETITISEEGSFTLSGKCEAEGNAFVIDELVNLYQLDTDSECSSLGSLATLSSLEVTNDILQVDGKNGTIEFFRI